MAERDCVTSRLGLDMWDDRHQNAYTFSRSISLSECLDQLRVICYSFSCSSSICIVVYYVRHRGLWSPDLKKSNSVHRYLVTHVSPHLRQNRCPHYQQAQYTPKRSYIANSQLVLVVCPRLSIRLPIFARCFKSISMQCGLLLYWMQPSMPIIHWEFTDLIHVCYLCLSDSWLLLVNWIHLMRKRRRMTLHIRQHNCSYSMRYWQTFFITLIQSESMAANQFTHMFASRWVSNCYVHTVEYVFCGLLQGGVDSKDQVVT